MLEENAKELGRRIGQSEEYKAVKRSTDALQQDAEATRMLNRMEEIRKAAQAMVDQGQEPTADMESELDKLLLEVQSRSSYQMAIAAQNNFDKLMLRVNSWIAEGIRAGAASPIILA